MCLKAITLITLVSVGQGPLFRVFHRLRCWCLLGSGHHQLNWGGTSFKLTHVVIGRIGYSQAVELRPEFLAMWVLHYDSLFIKGESWEGNTR